MGRGPKPARWVIQSGPPDEICLCKKMHKHVMFVMFCHELQRLWWNKLRRTPDNGFCIDQILGLVLLWRRYIDHVGPGSWFLDGCGHLPAGAKQQFPVVVFTTAKFTLSASFSSFAVCLNKLLSKPTAQKISTQSQPWLVVLVTLTYNHRHTHTPATQAQQRRGDRHHLCLVLAFMKAINGSLI